MWEVIFDAFKDTLIVFPFILIIYVLIELLENATSITKSKRTLQGKLAPLLGAATGLIPQCGFSVMAAKLYDKGYIRTGTILAVFLATSDEALIILLGNSTVSPLAAMSIVPLVLIKLAVAIGFGYLINFLFSNEQLTPIKHTARIHYEKDEVGLKIADPNGEHAYSCGREHDGKSNVRVYFVDPLLHSLKIALYLLIVNLVFGFIIFAVGEDVISQTMIGGAYFQPLITAAIGLIPNCASSVIITSAYVQKGIMFGSCVAGLCTNAGLGLVVLLKNTKKLKRNILIIIALYLISALVGIAINGVIELFGLI